MLIVTRNFDLSVGSAVALVGVVVAVLTVQARRRLRASPCSAALAVGVAMGAWQGWWVTRMGVSSFIVTLAGMLYFRGISMIVDQRRDGRAAAGVADRIRHRLPAARAGHRCSSWASFAVLRRLPVGDARAAPGSSA